MSDSRVLIITLPIANNYGGILQAYALQRYIRDMGIDARSTHPNIRSEWPGKSVARYGYHRLKRIVHAVNPTPATLTPDIYDYRNSPPRAFIEAHIKWVDAKAAFEAHNTSSWAALVVGSDQVWRSAYASVPKYLLDFAVGWQDIKRISYAASFGRDDLSEYSPELLNQSAQLAKRFDGISVREASGVELVEKGWGLEAEQHVDPTLLFDSDHYRSLLGVDSDVPQNCLFAYVLDRDPKKDSIVQAVALHLGLEEFDMLPPPIPSRKAFFADPLKYQLPPVQDWLQSFANASFVVTDSFHGTVFSILFHKPFLVIGNPDRGLARISSLLEMFGLQDRFVSNQRQINDQLLLSPIDWERVDSILEVERQRSSSYLQQHLGHLIH